MTPRPMTALDAADDRLARAVGKIRERAGDDRDVVWLVETIDRRAAAAGKVLRKKARGGKSARQAEALERRNQALRQLRVKLCPTFTPLAAAALICAKFQRYESDRWPRERDDVVKPRKEPQRTFYTILRNREAGGARMVGLPQLATILGKQESESLQLKDRTLRLKPEFEASS
jgi:hypothetical protein